METIVLDERAGSACSVYEDGSMAEEAFGKRPDSAVRASEVEYDPGTGDWVSTMGGEELCRGKDRSEVVRREHKIIAERMAESNE